MEPELERRVRERTLELENSNEALRRSQQVLATELDTAQRLQHVATRLINARETGTLYEQILDTVMAILHADFSSIQRFHPERGTSGELQLLGHRCFSAEAAKRWEWVRPTTRTTCGEALRTGRRVAVPDVRNCDFMSGSEDLDGYLGADIRAGQTSPLVSRSGALMGMVSTYWREPHELTASELRALDVLARMAADLIERSWAEEKLRESEERFHTMADTAPVMIWMAGPDKLWTFVNKTCLDFTGHTLEDKLGYGWIADIHPDDREQFLAEYNSAFDARKEFQFEIRARRADGEYLWMLTTGTPRFVPSKGFAGYIGTCVDLTEVKRTQQEALARQKLESLGVLAGGIAHDFNNLLGGILAEAELVETDLAVGSASREEIQRIKTAAIRGSEIVRELMIYAGENQKDLNQTVDVSRLVEEMLTLLKVSISKQVALRTDFRGDLPTVWGNAPQIRQVIMNLVLNASEAIGDKQGVITVTAVQVSGDRDLVTNNATALTPGDYLQIEVSDTGCGMTEEVQAKIFDPFFSTKFPARGLGLAVVQGIVRDLDGKINIVSAPGQGTAFQVLLPCAPKGASEIHSTITLSGPEKSNAQARTILVVEDDEPLRRAVSMGLRKRGFSVIEASEGSIALDLIHAHKDEIDVVLLDVTLPGASSREVFEEAFRIRPDMKVIVTSAYGEEVVDAHYSGLRVNHFIRKPFQLDDLVRSFGSVLSATAR
jgi:PAS domain S-box-containing protein